MKEISKYLLKFINKELGSHLVQENNQIPQQFIQNILSELQIANDAWKNEHSHIKYIDIPNNTLPNFSGDLRSPLKLVVGGHSAPLPKDDSFDYISEEVRTVLETRKKMGREYRFSINTQKIVLYLVYPFAPDDPIQSMSRAKIDSFFTDCLHKIYLWLHIANKQKPLTCSQQLNIYIYFTELFKILPEKKGEPIGEKHANTAFTTSCMPSTNIYVYREEEWFKVFIHESFHCLGFDFSHSQVLSESSKKQVLDIFPVISDVNLFETYCETFAEIVNVIFYVYLQNGNEVKRTEPHRGSKRFLDSFPRISFADSEKNENLEKNIDKIERYMIYERVFSCFQCAKVLHFYELTYEDLYKKDIKSKQLRTKYNEDTNVLAYYIIKSIYMTHLPAFFHWFSIDNHNSFVFKETQENMNAYCNIIRLYHSDPSFLKVIRDMESWLSAHDGENTLETKTLRMTVIE